MSYINCVAKGFPGTRERPWVAMRDPNHLIRVAVGASQGRRFNRKKDRLETLGGKLLARRIAHASSRKLPSPEGIIC